MTELTGIVTAIKIANSSSKKKALIEISIDNCLSNILEWQNLKVQIKKDKGQNCHLNF